MLFVKKIVVVKKLFIAISSECLSIFFSVLVIIIFLNKHDAGTADQQSHFWMNHIRKLAGQPTKAREDAN